YRMDGRDTLVLTGAQCGTTAKILNATLMLSYLEVNPIWQDTNSFTDILNMDHFMNRLEDNIYTIRELPDEYAWSAQEIYVSALRSAQVKNAPFRASAGWCLENVAPGFESYRIVVLIWLCWIPEDVGKE
ncbi:hypothetical protein Tco_0537007, partial [Tanacetum coccineum]